MTWIIATIGTIAFIAGTFLGFIVAAILSVAKDADNYDPVENDPEPRVSTQIFDGLAKRRNT